MADRGVSESRTSHDAGESAAAGHNQNSAPDTPFDFTAVLGIADAIPVMIAFLDRGQRYRFLNRALADWFERPRSDILGRTAREVLGEETYAIREPLIEAALGGERQWFAAEYSHPTRGSLAIQSEYIPQMGPDGEVRGLVMLVEDITEQRVAGRALKESEARFRRIADSAPVPMWVTRLDRTRDFVNDAYVELMGTTPEEARRINWADRIHPDDLQRMIDETRAGEASGEAYTLEARFARKPGEYRWMQAVSQPRRDADGALIGYIGVAADVTVVKEAELEMRRLVAERTAALTASEARFRSIFDTVLEIIVLLEPDGTVIEVNRTPASWRAAEPRLAIGKPLWEAPTLARYPGHEAALREGVERAARGEIFVREVAMERDGEPTAYLDVSVQPVRDESGDIAFLLFEARDITELKGAQEQLRQSQKMEALGQLTGGIAHDFNNLLTVVVGGLDLIAKKVEDAKLKRYADNALSAAERGARLTAQLLAFSRVQKLEVRPTQVAPLIENMRPLLRNVLGPGIAKRFDLDRDMMAVMADPTQLELAVLNLAINARDAMPDGGTLHFETRKVRVAGDPEMDDGDYIELAIRDTGTGMPPEVAARAFEPFFTTKEVGKGTGLGLSMVYGVARQSGGTARIESAPGEGTSVKLYFRRAEGGDEAGDSGEAAGGVTPRDSGAASVLVIDDDPDVRGFIADSLAEYGHRVHQAADGEAGLELFREERPDLVVLDFVMPGLSGADVARQILAEMPGQPILFVSGYSETEAIHRVAPAAPLLVKPFRADALDAAIRDALAAD
ncbi:MAG: PAS domain-containing protein [Pseudomonadota bacterium]|nr:PAS domain-containing protein [Pseudomonadota bacterium]